MNTFFDKNTDINIETALALSEKEYNHEELIELLKSGNIAEKQIAALKLDTLENVSDGQILVSNLTGCDGKIREAVALKINQLLSANNSLSSYLIYPEIFAAATIDINANICRLVIDSVLILINYKNFEKIYADKIILYIQEAFLALDKIIYKDKKYTINKQLFKLYWCLESLKLFANDLDDMSLYSILYRASKESEYTIREKVAQILIHLNSKIYDDLKIKLSNDENYYVRAVFTA